jgi:ATP-dependent Clp protease ATP-binding subunit ClpB
MTGTATKRVLDLTKRGTAAQKTQDHLSKYLVGQPKIVECFSDIIERYQAGLCDPTKPAGNVIILGGTGTGKTFSVECFAEALFGNPKAMIKIDCAEYQHGHEIAKLLGSPPGYLGHRETHPMFTQEAMNQYHNAEYKLGILLFDEIEKASDTLWTLLLGILDKAVCTCGDNTQVNFSQMIIVMTSNLGVSEVNELLGNRMGFVPATIEVKDKKKSDVILEAMKRKFTPEFLNRIDHTVIANTLTKDNCKEILGKELGKALYTVHKASGGILFRITPEAQEALFNEGYDPIYNARHIKRTVERRVTLPLAKVLSSDQVKQGEKITIGYDGNFEYYVEGI